MKWKQLIPVTTVSLVMALASCAQPAAEGSVSAVKNQTTMHTNPKMKVEIWSDIMCPFCYIGKRNYEAALQQFADARHIELEWHSFQLDPDISNERNGGQNLYQYLSERKGMSYEDAVRMTGQVTQTAKQAGLIYHFDKAVVANSFDAHRLIQLAKTKGLGDEAEERLFYAYFTEGKNFADHRVLQDMGKDIGLDPADVEQVLKTTAFTEEVNQDIREAAKLGVRGVPFFVFNQKYAVSGAQPASVFLETLEKSFADWRKEHPGILLEVAEGNGPSCTPEGICD